MRRFPSSTRRYNPVVIGLGAIALILLIAVLVLARDRTARDEPVAQGQAAGKRVAAPGDGCASQATYDRIKRELFRRAAVIRNADQAVFDRLATYSVVRMDRPLMREHDAELGTVRCTGHLSLDLPPGVAVLGGRRTLSADIDYVLQPAADGSGDVVMLEGVDSIVAPLATLARTGTRPPPPVEPTDPTAEPGVVAPLPPPAQAPAPTVQPAPQRQPTVTRSTPPAPAVRPAPATAGTRPSFNCRHARTRGEVAVCRDPGLAALDRQMSGSFYRALSQADARRRSQLTATRDDFLRHRDQCPSDACIAQTYQGRMREIRDIMEGDWRPRR